MTRPAYDGEMVGTILVHNTTKHRNRSVATCRVPLIEGQLPAEGDRFSVRTDHGVGLGIVAGARWPDESPRYLDVQLPVDIGAGELQHLDLSVSEEEPAPFRVPRALPGALRDLRLALKVGDETVSITGAKPELVGEGTGLLRTYRYRVRARNHPIWVEFHGTLISGHMLVRFDLDWGYSPGEGTDWPLTWDLPEVKLVVQGAVLALDHAEAKAVDWAQDESETSHTVTLLRPGSLAAGQSQSLRGRLLLWSSDTTAKPWASLIRPEQVETLLSERERPLFCRASGLDWMQSNAFGPFGDLLPELTPEQELVLASATFHYTRLEDMPWEAPRLGCNPRPADQGTQEDFGVVKLRQEILADSTWPMLLMDRAVRQEACRPTHEREDDVSPVTFNGRPDWLLTTGRPNKAIHRTVDTLFYDPSTAFEPARSGTGAEWRPHDAEHLSLNYLCGYALLSGDPWAVRECHHKTELWLAEFNLDPRRGLWPPPARGVGRPLKAACWLYLVTGREDLRRAAKNWAEHHHREWAKRDERLPVLAARDKGKWWAPWEESEASSGFAAIHRCMGLASAGHLSRILAETVVEHGIDYLDGRLTAAYHPPLYNDDGSLWTAQDEDSLRVHRSKSMIRWCMPALVIAWKRGRSDEVRARAKGMLRDYLGTETAPTEEIWDWLALEGFSLAELWS